MLTTVRHITAVPARLLALLVLCAAQVVILDNTGSTATTLATSAIANNGSAYSSHCLTNKKGFAFMTSVEYTLFRLDVNLVPRFGATGTMPATVEVLVEIWLDQATASPSGSATYSFRATGLITENSGNGFTSLVLPSRVLPASSLFHVITFSPQTSCTNSGPAPFRSRPLVSPAMPTGGAGTTSVTSVQFSGVTWSNAVNDNIPFRLLGNPGAFTDLQTWTDSTSGNPACATGQIVNLGSNIAVFGITTPNDNIAVDYYISSVVFYVATQAGGNVAAGTTYTLSLVSPSTASGFVTPTGGTIVSTTGSVPTSIGVSVRS
jgi:hypothetical protein